MTRRDYTSTKNITPERKSISNHCANPDCNKPLLFENREQFYLLQTQAGLIGPARNMRAFAIICSEFCCKNLKDNFFPRTKRAFLYTKYNELPSEVTKQIFKKEGATYHFRLAGDTEITGILQHTRHVFMTSPYWHSTKAWNSWEDNQKERSTQLFLKKYQESKKMGRPVTPRYQLAYVSLEAQRDFGKPQYSLVNLNIKPGQVDLYECSFTSFLLPKEMKFQPSYLRNITFDKCRISTDIISRSHNCIFKDCLFEESLLGDQFDTHTTFIDCTFSKMGLTTSNIDQCRFVGDVAFNDCGELPTALIKRLNERYRPYSIDGEVILPSGLSSPRSTDFLSRPSSRAASHTTSPVAQRRLFGLWPKRKYEQATPAERQAIMLNKK